MYYSTWGGSMLDWNIVHLLQNNMSHMKLHFVGYFLPLYTYETANIKIQLKTSLHETTKPSLQPWGFLINIYTIPYYIMLCSELSLCKSWSGIQRDATNQVPKQIGGRSKLTCCSKTLFLYLTSVPKDSIAIWLLVPSNSAWFLMNNILKSA